MIGLLRAYEGKPKVLPKIFSFLSSDAFRNNDLIKKEIESRRIDLALILVPLAFSNNESVANAAFDAVGKVSKFSGSKFSSLVQNLKPGKDKLFDQLMGLVDADSLNEIFDSVLASETHQEPALLVLTLLLGASTVQSLRSKEKGQGLCRKLIALTLKSTERFGVVLKAEGELEGDVPNSELLLTAARKGAIPSKVYDILVDALKSLPKFCLNPKAQLEMFLEVLVLGSTLKASGLDSASDKCFTVFGGKDEASLMAQVASMKMPKEMGALAMEQDKLRELFSQAQLFCAKQIASVMDNDKMVAFLPHLLTCLTNDNKKIRKTIFKSFENFVAANVTKKSKSAPFLSLLQQIVEHKSEILSNVVNLSDVMGEFVDLEANSDVLNNLLGMIIAAKSSEIFVQVNFSFCFIMMTRYLTDVIRFKIPLQFHAIFSVSVVWH